MYKSMKKMVTLGTVILIFSTKMLYFSTERVVSWQFFAYLTIVMTVRHAELATFVVATYII